MLIVLPVLLKNVILATVAILTCFAILARVASVARIDRAASDKKY